MHAYMHAYTYTFIYTLSYSRAFFFVFFLTRIHPSMYLYVYIYHDISPGEASAGVGAGGDDVGVVEAAGASGRAGFLREEMQRENKKRQAMQGRIAAVDFIVAIGNDGWVLCD